MKSNATSHDAARSVGVVCMAMVAALIWGACNDEAGSSAAEGCGDGVLNAAAGEQCDDGNAVDGDSCDASCALAPAVNEWLEAAPLRAREHAAMAYDEARSQFVMFGGTDHQTLLGDTWTWDGVAWTQALPAAAPSARLLHAMAYDPVRGQVVLFGGWDHEQMLGDTWTWNGTTWTKLSPATSPPRRRGHAMVFDAERGHVLLFGGNNENGFLSDTWTWNGTTWTQVNPALTPPARGWHGMAYDAERGQVVLFGGWAGGFIKYGDTWTWDGTTWAQQEVASAPTARDAHHLVYDAARREVVLFGGGGAEGGGRADTWLWNGATWNEAAPVTAPAARRKYSAGYDVARERVVLFAGVESWDGRDVPLGDGWEWNGAVWTQLYTPATRSPALVGHAMAYDEARGQAVVFGGVRLAQLPLFAETWTFDGLDWSKATSAVAPPARAYHAMAYDADRGEVVLFGGVVSDFDNESGDTWTWDGVTWTQRIGAGPPARVAHVMAYDAARKKVILFGGRDGTDYFGDTWSWDGDAWTQEATPGAAPEGRSHAALAYDASRDQMVLFGGLGIMRGLGDIGALADTWIWDGTSWAPAASPVAPSPRYGHTMSYDGRGNLILFGGGPNWIVDYVADYAETWRWDGSAWTEMSPAIAPWGRKFSQMAYDAARGRVMLFGGLADGVIKPDTWFWR